MASTTTQFTRVSPDEWKATVEAALAPGSFDRKLVTRIIEGVDVQPLYTSDDRSGAAAGSGHPGVAPFRRGAEPIGRFAERWDARTRIAHPDTRVANTQIKDDLGRDARSLWLRLDTSARHGRDQAGTPTERDALGVPCVSLAQLDALLDGVALDQVTIVLDAGGNALPAAAMLVALARKRGIDPARLRGSFAADPLGALAQDGRLPGPAERTPRQVIALARWTREHAPNITPITASGLPYHEAGAHAAQEIAFVLATGIEYLRWLVEGGLAVDDAARAIGFQVGVNADVYVEMAKLRALRELWAGVVLASGGSDAGAPANVHAVTSTTTKTQRDPWVNLLRETTETFAAAVGGADAITTSGFDRACGPSDAFARRLALNTQLILSEEAHIGRVADAAGGSYYIESLTDALGRVAWACLGRIEAAGGMTKALAGDLVANELRETNDARRQAIAKRKRPITGVSEFADPSETPVERAAPDWSACTAARKRWLADTTKPEAQLAALASAEREQLVEAAVAACEAGASLGRVTAALRGDEVHAMIEPLPLRRIATDYERMRDACDGHAASTGARPTVFLASLGPIPLHKPRADFARGLLFAGGLAVPESDGFETPQAAAHAFAASGAKVACICGSDDTYVEHAATLGKLLRERGAAEVLLAGRPGEHEKAWRDAGIGRFIFMGCDALEALEGIVAAAGVQGAKR